MNKQELVYKRLDALEIKYKVVYHQAAFTIDDVDGLGIGDKGNVVKNLFLRNANGKQHYLVVVSKDKRVNLKELKTQLGTSNLSFASEERLMKYLGLTKGSVSPLGIINDEKSLVAVVFDKDLVGDKAIGVHPNDNRATVFMGFEDLKGFIEDNGNEIQYVKI